MIMNFCSVRHHTDRWVLLYIERWLKAVMMEGGLAGTWNAAGWGYLTALANLFLHYAFDKWMDREKSAV